MRRAVAGAVAVLSLLCAAPPAGAITADSAVARLNAQREANGIPPVRLDPQRSDGCAKHDAYMARNGMGHGEDPSKPGYTAEGAGIGGSEVLSPAESWGTGFVDNPWATAPIHLLLMFDPSATSAGYDHSHGYACMRLGDFAASGGFHSVPGPGVRDVTTSQPTYDELPYTPAEAAGLDRDRTGFNLLLYPADPQEALARAELAGPAGAEAVSILTQGTTMADGGEWTWGTIVVPVLPLIAGADYVLTATWQDGTVQRVPFHTAAEAPDVDVDLSADGTGASVGASAITDVSEIRVTDPRGRPVARARRDSLAFRPAIPGRYRACAVAGGGHTGYARQRRCVRRRLRGQHLIRMRRVHGGLRITASPSARGLHATVSLSRPGHDMFGRVEVIRWQRHIVLRRTLRVRTPRGRFSVAYLDVPVKRTGQGRYWPVNLAQRYGRR